MDQPLSSATRNRKYVEKLKLNGNFADFKQKKAKYERARRQRLKESLATLSDSQRTQVLRQGRLQSLARVRKCRERKRQAVDIPMDQHISSSFKKIEEVSDSSTSSCKRIEQDTSEQHISSSCSPSQFLLKSANTKINFEHSFKTLAELAEAVAKADRSLPVSPSKRKAVIAKLFYELDEKSQREIYQNQATIKRTGHKRISASLIQEIQRFYQRDDISRLSANVEDLVNIIHPSGEREQLRLRHLVYTLKQAYALFIKENTEASVSLAKFCSLRPVHVKLCSKDFDVTSMLQVDFSENLSSDG